MKHKEDLRIVFMGTPEFAVTILEKIIQEEYQVVSVVTVPDKPAGRGQKLSESAVKICAKNHNIPILQPISLKDEDFVNTLQNLQADLFIVVAFRMLPKIVWEIPAMGTFNLHGSLLPQYRGAAPINWAIINGETETGVTTFMIDEKIDTGKILLKEKMTIGEEETAGELHDRMMVLGAEVVVNTIELLRKGEINATPQEEKELKPAPKIQKQDCLLDFSMSVFELHNFIRGMSPYPTAWIWLEHKESKERKSLKIFRSTIHNTKENADIKLTEDNRKLFLELYSGTLSLQEVQLEGKKRMDTATFMLGFKVNEWRILLTV